MSRSRIESWGVIEHTHTLPTIPALPFYSPHSAQSLCSGLTTAVSGRPRGPAKSHGTWSKKLQVRKNSSGCFPRIPQEQGKRTNGAVWCVVYIPETPAQLRSGGLDGRSWVVGLPLGRWCSFVTCWEMRGCREVGRTSVEQWSELKLRFPPGWMQSSYLLVISGSTSEFWVSHLFYQPEFLPGE